MKMVLFPVMFDSQFVELSRVAKLLDGAGEYKPFLWFPNSYPGIERDLEVCSRSGWEHLAEALPVRTVQNIKRHLNKIPWQIRILLLTIIHMFRKMKNIKFNVRRFQAFLNEMQPALLILSEDNVGYDTHIYVSLAETRNIPTVIVPYTIANATEAAEFFIDSPMHLVSSHILNRLIAALYPHWVYVHRGKKVLRLPVWDIIAFESAGYRPSNPWTLFSEDSTIVAVENERMLEYYRKEGLSAERLIVTGALYDDVLAEATSRSGEMRERLMEEYGLQADRPLLLCALPPSQFPRECEFADFDSLASFWMETLSSVRDWNFIVRPHPRLTNEEIGHLKDLGIKFSDWDTATLVPLCDLYVASVSATIRWAIACGKPVLNYDVYQMKYEDYKNAGGVLTVFSKNDFNKSIKRLTSDAGYYHEVSDLQHKEMTKWGRLDGKSSERMLKLFDDVVSGKIRAHTK